MDESNFVPDGWLDDDPTPEVEALDPRAVNDDPPVQSQSFSSKREKERAASFSLEVYTCSDGGTSFTALGSSASTSGVGSSSNQPSGTNLDSSVSPAVA